MYLAGIGTRAEQDPDGIALRDRAGVLTWSQVAHQIRGVAAALCAMELDDSARLGVSGDNAAATLVAHAAGLLAGVGTVALHRQATATEMTHEVGDTGCEVVVTGPAGLEAVIAAVPATEVRAVVVHGTTPPEWTIAWESWAAATGPVPPAEGPARPLLVFTSGTTGRAGATPVSWLPDGDDVDVLTYAQGVSAESGFPAGPHLVVGPLQHTGPLTSLRHLLSGQPVIVLDRFDAQEVLRLIEEHRVSSTVMVPTHFSRLLALDEAVRKSFDLSSMQRAAHTGAACPEAVKRAMIDWWGPVFVEAYGGSEVGTLCRINSADWLERPGSVGQAIAPLVIEAYDEAAVAQPRGTTGILGITLPPGRSVRFLGDEAKSAKAYIAPGIATLGDVGHVDADGFVFITDRIADMVVSGGVNLYPAESEQVLIKHPAVQEVAVIGVPDADMGEALLALVVTDADPADLDRFCRTELAGYKCPRTYEVRAVLPRNEMGKLDKRALRAPYWSGARTIAG